MVHAYRYLQEWHEFFVGAASESLLVLLQSTSLAFSRDALHSIAQVCIIVIATMFSYCCTCEGRMCACAREGGGGTRRQ
jgi:hypothetical protein